LLSERVKGLGKWAVRVGLTIAVTYFLFRSLNVSWGELKGVDPSGWRPRVPELGLSVALLLAVFVYTATLWATMVRALGGPALGLSKVIEIFYLANLGRYIPGKVWQLAGLTYLAGKEGVSIGVASSAAVLGQVYSLGAAAIVGLVGLGLGGYASIAPKLAPFAIGLAAMITAAVTLPTLLRRALGLAFRLTRSPDPVPQLDAWFGVRWLALYLPVWVAYGIAFGLLWRSFPELPPVAWALAIGSFAGAYFLGYAAIFAPAGVGVREGALALLLAPAMGPTAAAVLAIVARIWMTLAELIPVAFTGARKLQERSHGS
jgi:uncharacterized membrane protein YbhN (UPF0104 family)